MNAFDIINKSNKIIAISNYEFSKEIEDYASNFDCIIRFNKGSNPISLSSQISNVFNNRVDVCVLSGWPTGDFGPLQGFEKKIILFSRPKFEKSLTGMHRKISVGDYFLNKITKHTNNISFIPHEIFLDLHKEEKYDHPTTGFITAYYIKKFLNKQIELVNFFRQDKKKLYNCFLDKSVSSSTHNLSKESKILSDLGIKNIKI